MGAFEAKTRRSALLERVAGGEEVVITRHGRPIARLVPERGLERARIGAAMARIKELAKGHRLEGHSIREFRDEGRA